jgi:hypothetical protein
MTTKLKSLATWVTTSGALAGLCLALLPAPAAEAENNTPTKPEPLAKMMKLIKPQPGESKFMEIPWLTSVWDARKKAAAEGKPIFIWAGSDGSPVGIC